jgi:DNA-binding CsgD family transcriptional regulator
VSRKSQVEHHLPTILEWNAQGIDRKEMALRLGLSRHSIQAFLQRRGILAASLPGSSLLSREAEIRDMIEIQKMTQAQVAATLGVHPSTVERLCSSLGLRTARTGPRAAERHFEWSGGRILAKHWYIEIFVPLHPLSKNSGYVSEHRLSLEVFLGRYLLPTEVVDHEDGHTQHNWPGNLRLYASNADHLRATLSGREKASRVRSVFGDWPSNRKTHPCPSPDETLAQSPSGFRERLEHHIRIHRTTQQHAHLARKTLLRSGPWSPPFQQTTTDQSTGCLPQGAALGA